MADAACMAALDGDAPFHAMINCGDAAALCRYRQPSGSGAGYRGGIMTSEERREARYLRRVAGRKARKAKYESADSFDRVFSYEHLYRAYRCCRRNVAWKSSVQKYIVNAPLNLYQTYRRLQNGSYKSPGFFEFDVYERGKARHIRSTIIGERVVQRCLCDNALVPMLERSLIYDNGASMKKKGYDFAINRLTLHLRQHYRRYGTEGYILLFDFKKFFDNIDHAVITRHLRRAFSDQRLLDLVEHFVGMFGPVGLGLGSQISQVLALVSATRLDHFIKETLRIHAYARYNDDGYLIHPSKKHLQECLVKIRALCAELGITLNEKKTQIVKLSRGFTWLKARFFLTDTGRVVRKIYKRSVTKMRQKLKKLRLRWLAEKMTFADIAASWQSWKSYAQKFHAWHTVQNMGKLYNQLFLWEGQYVY